MGNHANSVETSSEFNEFSDQINELIRRDRKKNLNRRPSKLGIKVEIPENRLISSNQKNYLLEKIAEKLVSGYKYSILEDLYMQNLIGESATAILTDCTGTDSALNRKEAFDKLDDTFNISSEIDDFSVPLEKNPIGTGMLNENSNKYLSVKIDIKGKSIAKVVSPYRAKSPKQLFDKELLRKSFINMIDKFTNQNPHAKVAETKKRKVAR